MSNNNTGSFIGGVLIGSAIGTALGILIAPRSGRETRQILKKSADALPELAEDLSATIQLQTDRLSESAVQSWEETLIRLKDAIAAGMEASQMKTQELTQPRNVTIESSASNSNNPA
ncbi:MAG: YtxH domain-containing protein [Cyanobacteria bacterium P01_E01_bin.42]